MTAPPDNERYVRITSGGKIKTWVANSLNFLLEENENKTVILHTLPTEVEPTSQPSHETSNLSIKQQTASNTSLTVPRLISVAEIIKREYVNILQEKRSSRMLGLYQYNEIGTLEQLGVSVTPNTVASDKVSPEDLRSLQIIDALRGKNHPRQSQSPYMRIILSTTERPDLIKKGATFQSPEKRKISKSAKYRARKREKKEGKTEVSLPAPDVDSSES